MGRARPWPLTSDCTPRYVAADPYEGGKQAVAEAWRNLTAVGAEPIAITDNLNFGNPERPEIMGQIVARHRGHGRSLPRPRLPGRERQCLALQRDQRRGHSAHAGGGRRRSDRRQRAPRRFRLDEDGRQTLVLVGETLGELGAEPLSARIALGREDGAPPPVDLAAERRNGNFVRGTDRLGRRQGPYTIFRMAA